MCAYAIKYNGAGHLRVSMNDTVWIKRYGNQLIHGQDLAV